MQILVHIFLSFIVAVSISLFAVPVIVRIVKKLKLLDQPNIRSSAGTPIPTLGGIAIFFGFMFGSVFGSFGYELPELIYILTATILVLFIGLKDDLVTLTPVKKIVGQFIAAGIIIFMADIRFTNLHGFLGIYEIGIGSGVLLTGFTIVVLINALNLTDGIDGLASGISMLASIIFGGWFYISGHTSYAILSFSLVGALAGFFYYNVYGKQNKIFMGDTGSLFLGTIMSVLMIRFNEFNIDQTQPYAIQSAPAISFGILAYPLIDTIRVMIIRIIQHRSPFHADKNHLHHRLLVLGFSHKNATYTILSLNILFIIAVFALHQIGILRLMVYIFVSGGLLFMIPAYFIRSRKLIRKNDPVQQLLIPGSSEELLKNKRSKNLRIRKTMQGESN
jgi:UDP-GlcNAc:undecaprenyl-phosphate/decaprenyl-phosphate GlcNAc-1-phosphate transferase